MPIGSAYPNFINFVEGWAEQEFKAMLGYFILKIKHSPKPLHNA